MCISSQSSILIITMFKSHYLLQRSRNPELDAWGSLVEAIQLLFAAFCSHYSGIPAFCSQYSLLQSAASEEILDSEAIVYWEQWNTGSRMQLWNTGSRIQLWNTGSRMQL
jgi:hypothetical protein